MARGTNTGGDAVTYTIDGRPLNDIWAELHTTAGMQNTARDNLVAHFAYRTTEAGAAVPQTSIPEDFEDASEFGQPVGIRVPGEAALLGFGLKTRDLATRFTHFFLRDALAAQVEAVAEQAFEADNRQVYMSVLGAAINPLSRVSPEGLTVFPLYNGDGTVPPEWNGRTFDGTHRHHIISGSPTFDGGDVRDVYKLVAEHGHGDATMGGRVVVFLNPNEAEAIRGFSKGSPATDPYDWIPSTGTDAYLASEQIIGDPAPSSLGRIRIAGSYGPVWVSESSLIPAGYVVALATYGVNDQRAVVALREHRRPEYRGLLQIPGRNPDYPLQDSFFSRTWGTGIRQRGGAAVVQVKASGSYSVPAAYATVLA